MDATNGKEVQTVALAMPWAPALPVRNSSIYVESIKRFIDVFVSLAAFVVCLPVMGAVALLIMLDSKGSPIYRQKRVGANGKIFEIYKLRTMYPGTGPYCFKTTDGDWRVTRLGAMLRATKLDELPQLFNIVAGDMSIIGPRPLSVFECNHIVDSGFDMNCPGFVPAARPGLLGLEQINRLRELSYKERFALNHRYESGLSWHMDLEILFKSLWQCRHVCLAAGCAFVGELLLLCYLAM